MSDEIQRITAPESMGAQLGPPDVDDLAALYFLRYKLRGTNLDIVRAAHHALEGSADGSASPQALFNRAEILKHLGLRTAARDTWQQYFATKDDPAWQEEARSRSSRPLEGGPGVYDISERQRWFLSELPGVARRLAENPGSVDSSELAQLRDAAEELQDDTGGDAFYLDLVAFVTTPNGAREVVALDNPAAATTPLGAWLESLESDGEPGPTPAFTSPFAFWVVYERATWPPEKLPQERRLLLYEALAERALEKNYWGLAVQSYWGLGRVESELRRPDRALEQYRAGLEIFAETPFRDDGLFLGFHPLMAEARDQLRDVDGAWDYLVPALASVHQLIPRRRFQAFGIAGALAINDDRLELAYAFWDAAAASALAAETEGIEWAYIHAVIMRSLARFRLGDVRGAEDDLRLARARVESEGQARSELEFGTYEIRVRGTLARVAGEQTLDDAPGLAVDLFNEALGYFRAVEYAFYELETLQLRARAHIAGGNADDAEQDLDEFVDALEELRDRLLPVERLTLFESAHQTFTLRTQLHLEQGESERAFDSLEQQRSRNLLDLVSRRGAFALEDLRADPGDILNVRQLQAALLPNTVLAEYAILDDGLWVFIVSRDDFRPQYVALGADDLDRMSSAFVGAVQDAVEGNEDELARQLYEHLLAPVVGAAADSDHLVIVPDRFLHDVPFHALMREQDGEMHYVIETWKVSYSPSASLYAWSIGRDAELAAAPFDRSEVGSTVIVGNPTIDNDNYPYPPLPGAELEAIELSVRYAPTVPLIGVAATPAAILEQLRSGAEMLQFGGHAVVDLETPSESMLLCSRPDDGGPSVLTAAEIERGEFERLRLTVLSACQSAAGQLYATEGRMSLARAFMAAGVPAVVGSLWLVEDDGTKDLMTGFHDHLPESAGVAAALQSAQIDLLRAGIPPRVWAAFTVTGHSGYRGPQR